MSDEKLNHSWECPPADVKKIIQTNVDSIINQIFDAASSAPSGQYTNVLMNILQNVTGNVLGTVWLPEHKDVLKTVILEEFPPIVLELALFILTKNNPRKDMH